eukprot:TRINITY_DN946_c0_g2_i1.p1 TRINITY_DN946_c0_g2~~TRINITY_DN946_c0_g2_i1.p1  ORF type:complete len:1565 (+),score=548.44 TRINITY_DN946_c0_g2_i1:194-4888(+)
MEGTSDGAHETHGTTGSNLKDKDEENEPESSAYVDMDDMDDMDDVSSVKSFSLDDLNFDDFSLDKVLDSARKHAAAFQTPDLSSFDSMLDERMSKVETWASEIESLSAEQQSVMEKSVHMSHGPSQLENGNDGDKESTSSLGESEHDDDDDDEGSGISHGNDDIGDKTNDEKNARKHRLHDASRMKPDPGRGGDEMSWLDSILAVDGADLEPENVNILRRLHQEHQRRKEEEEAEHMRQKRMGNDAMLLKQDRIALEEARKERERRQEEEAAERAKMIEEMEEAMTAEVHRLEEEARAMEQEKLRAEREWNERDIAEKRRKEELKRLENERMMATERRKRAQEVAFTELQRNAMRKEDAFAHSWREEIRERILKEEERKRKEIERIRLEKWKRECDAITEIAWDLLWQAIYNSVCQETMDEYLRQKREREVFLQLELERELRRKKQEEEEAIRRKEAEIRAEEEKKRREEEERRRKEEEMERRRKEQLEAASRKEKEEKERKEREERERQQSIREGVLHYARKAAESNQMGFDGTVSAPRVAWASSRTVQRTFAPLSGDSVTIVVPMRERHPPVSEEFETHFEEQEGNLDGRCVESTLNVRFKDPAHTFSSFRKLRRLFEEGLTDSEILAKLSLWKKTSREYGWIDSSGNGPQTVDPSALDCTRVPMPSSTHFDAHERIPDGSVLLDEDFAMMHAPPNVIRPEEVEVLDVSLEHIGSISSDVKEYFTSLRMLVLNGNEFRVFPGLSSMKTLQVVHMKDNQVDSFNSSALPQGIEEVDLSLNKIVCFDSGRPAMHLKRLRLESNAIESFDGSLFPSLTELRLYRNEIVDVRCMRGCSLLQSVDLGRNHIFDMEDVGTMHPLLIDLVLYENQISKIATNWSCVLLKSLYLNGNQIEKLPEIIHLPMLETLQLQENKIESIRFSSSCVSLKYLDLSFNRIANPIELQNLRRLTSLQTLSLSDNPVTKHPYYLSFVLCVAPSLKTLDLDDISSEERDCISLSLCRMWPEAFAWKPSNPISASYVHLCRSQAQERNSSRFARRLRSGKPDPFRDFLDMSMQCQDANAMIKRHWKEHADFSASSFYQHINVFRKRTSFWKEKRRMEASVKIQTLFRGFIARKKNVGCVRVQRQLRKRREGRQKSALTIQRVYRGFRVRRALRGIRFVDDDDFDYEEVDVNGFLPMVDHDLLDDFQFDFPEINPSRKKPSKHAKKSKQSKPSTLKDGETSPSRDNDESFTAQSGRKKMKTKGRQVHRELTEDRSLDGSRNDGMDQEDEFLMDDHRATDEFMRSHGRSAESTTDASHPHEFDDEFRSSQFTPRLPTMSQSDKRSALRTSSSDYGFIERSGMDSIVADGEVNEPASSMFTHDRTIKSADDRFERDLKEEKKAQAKVMKPAEEAWGTHSHVSSLSPVEKRAKMQEKIAQEWHIHEKSKAEGISRYYEKYRKMQWRRQKKKEMQDPIKRLEKFRKNAGLPTRGPLRSTIADQSQSRRHSMRDRTGISGGVVEDVSVDMDMDMDTDMDIGMDMEVLSVSSTSEDPFEMEDERLKKKRPFIPLKRVNLSWDPLKETK